jgi:type IV secretory pathway protease TraF
MSGSAVIKRIAYKRSRPAVAIVLAGILLALVLVIAGAAGGLRINITPSEPLGLWRLVALDRRPAVGDLVFICPPETKEIRGQGSVAICVRDYAQAGLRLLSKQ